MKNPGNHNSTKHIETRYLYARQVYEEKRINIKYCPTNDMIADALTKALSGEKFEKFRELMGVQDVQNYCLES